MWPGDILTPEKKSPGLLGLLLWLTASRDVRNTAAWYTAHVDSPARDFNVPQKLLLGFVRTSGEASQITRQTLLNFEIGIANRRKKIAIVPFFPTGAEPRAIGAGPAYGLLAVVSIVPVGD